MFEPCIRWETQSGKDLIFLMFNFCYNRFQDQWTLTTLVLANPKEGIWTFDLDLFQVNLNMTMGQCFKYDFGYVFNLVFLMMCMCKYTKARKVTVVFDTNYNLVGF